MKVCVIGDIHGTSKFLECYMDIIKYDNDCEKIIVCGDHFDPYENIGVDEMIEKYKEFIDICHEDDRIISLLGNHDLATYVIYNDCTNRTDRHPIYQNKISDEILKNISDSYLLYKIGNYIFSHAGVSKYWLEQIAKFDNNYVERLMNNYKGWSESELTDLVSYRYTDFSGCGDSVYQGCTWIRPRSLVSCAIDGYNQVVGHTQVEEIVNITMDNGMTLYLVDNMRKSKYLTLNIDESE